MTWLLWRQHRLQVLLAALALAAFAVPVAITGRNLADQLATCRAKSGCSGFSITQGFTYINPVVDSTIVVPLLIGMFWGATVVGKELDTGTHVLAWSQSVTRRRWVRAKIGTLFVQTLVCSAAVAALVTWWSDAHNSVVESRFSGLQFDIQGLAPVGYSLFAAALGLVASVTWRRVLPAMATTVGGFAAVRLLVELVIRPHYVAPVRLSSSMSAGPGGPAGSWVQSTLLTRHGTVLHDPIEVPVRCAEATGRRASDRCMDGLGYRIRTTYQPAGRYWTFQWIEFGIFAALAVALAVAAVMILRRRDG